MNRYAMTADHQSAAPGILPVGEVPARRLGFGSMQLTGPGRWGAPDSPEQVMRVLRDAVSAGMTHIDTAYLATGLSLPPQVPLPMPPMLLAAAARARALLLLATDVAAHLIAKPAHAWSVALHGCYQLACGQSR